MFCPGRFPFDFAIWVENRILKNIAPTTGNRTKSDIHAKIVEISKDQCHFLQMAKHVGIGQKNACFLKGVAKVASYEKRLIFHWFL